MLWILLILCIRLILRILGILWIVCVCDSFSLGTGGGRGRGQVGRIVGSVAKWLCCPLREATSAALPYTRRAGFLVLPESTRPVQPRSTEPQPPSPKRNFTRGGVLSRSDWLQTPLRHASNPCGSFSLRASANWCVLGPTEGATTHHH